MVVNYIHRPFRCVDGCSDCCIYRQYFPSVEYGKTGVLLLPHEKLKIESCAQRNGTEIKILPRIGIGDERHNAGPDKIIMYQMMGKDTNGNTCPFLDIDSYKKAPNGGYPCKIYEKRPLACQAYPVSHCTKNQNPVLDTRCKFCEGNVNKPEKNSLIKELAALEQIKGNTRISTTTPVWRYATHIGEEKDRKKFLPEGWVLQHV